MNSDTGQPPLRTYSALFCIIASLLSAALCVSLPLLLIPEMSRSPHFWFKVGWLLFLSTMFWLAIGFFLLPLRRLASARLGVPRIAPAITYVVTLYCLLSAGLLVLGSVWNRYPYLNRLHLAGQIVLFACAAVLVLVLGLPVFFAPRSRNTESDGTQH